MVNFNYRLGEGVMKQNITINTIPIGSSSFPKEYRQ